jgi:hypothetical protein
MTCSLPADISIHCDGEHLILPSGLGGDDIAAIVKDKADILKSLRASQMNAAGFYTTLPRSLLRELQAALWVSLKIETTAPTRFSIPTRVSAETHVGSMEWSSYRVANPGTRINTSPRIRVLSVQVPTLGTCLWDLDTLAVEEQQDLYHAVLDNKTVIVHDAGLDLSWLFAETAARPEFVLNSMLLMRHLRPGELLRPFKTAAIGDRLKPGLAK